MGVSAILTLDNSVAVPEVSDIPITPVICGIAVNRNMEVVAAMCSDSTSAFLVVAAPRVALTV